MYKTEKYLRDCLDSLSLQSLRDVEFILIDDGSPDNCGAIAEEYAGKDNRFVVVHKSNGGLVSAWKEGLKNAAGDYIGFVDSDDFVDGDMFNKMTDMAIEHCVDMVCCGMVAFNNGEKQERRLIASPGYYNRKKIENVILPYIIDAGEYNGYSRILNSARVNKIFRRELLSSNLQYFDSRVSFGEDLIVTYAAVAKAESIYVMNECFYYYRYNGQSITHKYNPTLQIENDLCISIYEQITKDNNLHQYKDQIYRNAAHISFRLISNVLLIPGITVKDAKTAIKKIINDEYVVKGARLVDTHKASIVVKIKFYLLRHKFYNLLYLVYHHKKRQITNG